jgi:hypothetical protein
VRAWRRVLLLVVVGCLWPGAGVAFASGVPGWDLSVVPAPVSFSGVLNAQCAAAGESFGEQIKFCDGYTATAANRGAGASSGSPIKVGLSYNTTAGLTIVGVALVIRESTEPGARSTAVELPVGEDCTIGAASVSCSVSGQRVAPDGLVQLHVFVSVDEPVTPAPVTGVASVEGGGAGRVPLSFANSVEGPAPAFGFYGFSAGLVGDGGLPEPAAGGHPAEFPLTIDLNTIVRDTAEGATRPDSVGDPRDIVIDLPLGVSGSAVSAPQCTLHQLAAKGAGGAIASSCPADTIVGSILTQPEGLIAGNSPIYNLVPEHGVAAEFGFLDTTNGPHVVDVGIAPTPEGYVVRSSASEITQITLAEIISSIYGDPAARDKSRQPGVPMFTNPSVCTGKPLVTKIFMDSWQDPGVRNPDGSPAVEDAAGGWASAESVSPAVTGCEALVESFAPTISAQTERQDADTPTGLNVAITVPQPEQPEALGVPPVKEIEVALPEGLTVNPSSANGLAACSEAQIGWQGKTPGETSELQDFDTAPAEATPAEEAQASAGVAGEPAHCPKASRIGTVEVETPALTGEACKGESRSLSECAREEPAGSASFPEREKTPLLGAVYLARQSENPFESLIAAYFVIDDPRTGLVVKLPGKVQLNETTGQLTTIVKDSPQFPFSQLRTHIFGGETASLSTPMHCGSYPLSSALTPWSHEPGPGETTGTPVANPSSAVEVSTGLAGAACPGVLAFKPGVQAGTSTSQAASGATVDVSINRGDDEQEITGVNLTTRPGLTALIKNVPRCPEPQAAEGNCSPESLIGEATSAVGAGSKPYWVHAGKVYLTGPYNNGPFGLSIVIPTTAGPFTLTGVHGGLGKEVVRASLRVNPATAQASSITEGIPQRIQGITLQIRTIDVTINRPQFVLNPTNCEALPTTADITSAEDASEILSIPFHLTGCANLPFAPKLTATAAAQASKLNGTTFAVTVKSPGLGQANIHKVDLTIPSVLPSRLETIQKACPDKTFETNPASCDEGSIIGQATVQTPILANPLHGPAYLVSHAAAAFPDIEFVLQSEGVTIILDGKTDIKNKITYSDFETAPDAPFTTFETIFPAGPHSALTADIPEREFYNLCHQPRITMPTTIVAQNNAQIHQNTTIELTGCPKKLQIITHKHNNHTHTLTLTIYIPTAGKLQATGHGIKTTTTKTTTRELITLKIHLNHHHPTHTLIHLQLTPTTGPKQTTTTHTTL